MIYFNAILFLILGVAVAYGDTTPTLYSTPNYQSPSETESNRIVNIPGYDIDVNASVYYEEISDTDTIPSHPDFLPTEQSNKKEFANIISNNDAPYSLSVKFPESATQEKIYALWVKNRQGDWSKRILLNDPRPQWIFPKRGYVTEGFSTFGRRYFIAGRNLKLAADKQLPITLTDNTTDTTYTVIPKIYKEKSAEYLLYFDLPSTMQEGNYTVSLFGRETSNQLTIVQDPLPKQRFDITDYGALPDDNQDDTHAMRDAIAAAVANGGGVVYFPEGTWEFSKVPAVGDTYGEYHYNGTGHVLEPHIDLVGAGKEKTKIVKKPTWNIHGAFFTTQGHNIIKDISFIEEVESHEGKEGFNAFFIGKKPWGLSAGDQRIIKNVQIQNCYFEGMDRAINSYGLPVQELYISDNVFFPYSDGITIGGGAETKYPQYERFALEDGVIFHNTFYPGDFIGEYTAEGVPTQGPIAFALSGQRRFAAVDNLIDGRDEYDGFRAGIHGYNTDSIEHYLVANNSIYCSGDRAGDGEGIGTEANYAVGAFDSTAAILEATPTSVTPAKALDKNVTDYYKDFWVYVVSGPGVGQVRKVIHNQAEPYTPLEIEPAWDVVPVVGESTIVVQTSNNWIYIIDNFIDNKNGCKEIKPISHPTGSISIYAMNADSSISYNHKIWSAGILINVQFDHEHTKANYNLLIKGNIHNNEDSELYRGGGIMLFHGRELTDEAYRVVAHDIDIFKNTLNNAYTYAAGENQAIGYWAGAYPPNKPKSFKNVIISQNKISNVENGIGSLWWMQSEQIFNNIICDNLFENVWNKEIELDNAMAYVDGLVKCTYPTMFDTLDWSENLVLNGDAQSGADNWTVESGERLMIGDDNGRNSDYYGYHNYHDSLYFYARNAGVVVYQDIPLDSEAKMFWLSADQGGYDYQYSSEVSIEFLDGDGNVLKRFSLSVQKERKFEVFVNHKVTDMIPDGSVRARIRMDIKNTLKGGHALGFVDNIIFKTAKE